MIEFEHGTSAWMEASKPIPTHWTRLDQTRTRTQPVDTTATITHSGRMDTWENIKGYLAMAALAVIAAVALIGVLAIDERNGGVDHGHEPIDRQYQATCFATHC